MPKNKNKPKQTKENKNKWLKTKKGKWGNRKWHIDDPYVEVT